MTLIQNIKIDRGLLQEYRVLVLYMFPLLNSSLAWPLETTICIAITPFHSNQLMYRSRSPRPVS